VDIEVKNLSSKVMPNQSQIRRESARDETNVLNLIPFPPGRLRGATMRGHSGSGPVVMNVTFACDNWPTLADAPLAIISGLFDKIAEVF
jgi:hypothetical protein